MSGGLGGGSLNTRPLAGRGSAHNKPIKLRRFGEDKTFWVNFRK